MKNRRLLTAVASPLVIAVSGGSWAQEAPVFEEVLVTAEKRTESLQNLSQAVTALSAEDVENRQLNSFVDLSAIAPGVNVAKNEGLRPLSPSAVSVTRRTRMRLPTRRSYHLDGVYVASLLPCKPIS